MADENRSTRLGRGLSALLGNDAPIAAPPVLAKQEPQGGARLMPTAQLKPSPFQPRRRFDEEALAELAASLKSKGVLQPLLVRPAAGEPGVHEIVAGERRWRAAQKAGIHDVPVIVRDLTDREVLEVALIENVQRADLTAVEEAEGYRSLIEQYKYTQDELARIVGKSRSHIANTLRLLSLPPKVLSMIASGALTAGHARTLIGRSDAERLAEAIVAGDLTVRGAEDLAKRGVARKREADAPDADTEALERELSEILGLIVHLAHKGEKGGEVRIRYRSLEQLDDVCARLRRSFGAAA